jgi:hypothetical protein
MYLTIFLVGCVCMDSKTNVLTLSFYGSLLFKFINLQLHAIFFVYVSLNLYSIKFIIL